MKRKTKQIILISGIAIAVSTIIAVPVGVVVSQKQNSPKTIELKSEFREVINSFIQLHSIANGDWFNNSNNVQLFNEYLNEIIPGAKFNVTTNGNYITLSIINKYVFAPYNDEYINVDQENNSVTIDVVWYNPIKWNIYSTEMFNFVQNFITENKINQLNKLESNDSFNKALLNEILQLNPGLSPQLTSDEINIFVDQESQSIKVEIELYVNAIFTINNGNSNVELSNTQTNKEITIKGFELYNTEINFSNTLIDNIQQIIIDNNLSFPSYLNTEQGSINISNAIIINELINCLNSTTNEDDFKLTPNDINNISYSLLSSSASYGDYLPNIANINLKIELNDSANFEFVDNSNNSTISNNGKTIDISLFAFNGLIVNDAMANSSTNINNFINVNNISYSNANSMINDPNGGAFDQFWYTFLTGNDFNETPESYLDYIDPNLYTMSFTPTSIEITFNDNCGYRFYANQLVNNDVVVSSDYKSITINNIKWPKESVNISTTDATTENLTNIFAKYGIYNASLINNYKKEIISGLFNNQLPSEYCNLQYDSELNQITFNIINNDSLSITYNFDINGSPAQSFSIQNVTFPSTLISPINNYTEIVQKSIFNNSISTEDELNNYIDSIVSTIFSNKLSPNQYQSTISNNNVTLTINEDVNIEFLINPEEPDNVSKTFTFPFVLCTEIIINTKYQDIITQEFLTNNNINETNLGNPESIAIILDAIVDNSNKDELIPLIADLITITYKPSTESDFTLNDSRVDVNKPYSFLLGTENTKVIKIIFDFGSSSVDTPTDQPVLSRFFKAYK